MYTKTKLILLLTIWFLNASCTEKQSPEKQVKQETLTSATPSDTLRFNSGIRAILQDSRGHYWFGSHADGVSHYDGKSFEYFNTTDGLQDNQIRSIQEDQDGIIWFGTAKGVSSFDGKTIKNYPVHENEETEWAKTDHDLWFNAGTQEGVYRFDGQKLNFLAFPAPKVMHSGNVYAVTDISKGKNNRIWFATYAGVMGYDGNQFTIINDETLHPSEKSEKIHVRSILEDSRGRLWIGNNGIGVLLKTGDSTINFSREQGKLIPANKFEANIQLQPATQYTGLHAVFAIAEDREGIIWFGDRDSGAWKYDGKELINYVIDPKLSSQMIWDIYEDQHQNLLFGMAAGGVYRFNGKTFDRWL